jgi:hypothetical protein
MVECLVNDELERIWMEMAMAKSRYYPSICLEGLRKTTKTPIRIDNVVAKIQTKHPPN